MVSECRITDAYHKGAVPGLIIGLAGWVDLSPNFSGSGAVVLWGFGVQCCRVKVILRRARLVLGWVTLFGHVHHLGV